MKKIKLFLSIFCLFLLLVGCVDNIELGLIIDTDKGLVESGVLKISDVTGKETRKITNIKAVNANSVFKSNSAKISLNTMPEVMEGLSYLTFMTSLMTMSPENEEIPPVYLFLSVATNTKKIKNMSIQFANKKLPLEKVEDQENVFKLNLIPVIQSKEMMNLVAQRLNEEEESEIPFYLNIAYGGSGFTPLAWVSNAANAVWRAVSGFFLGLIALFSF